MSLSLGIVGLPNVGKSTLFNALTRSKVLAANYPFATIEPNVGIVGVPDARLEPLAEIFKPEKVTPASVTFLDIAGLVAGAHKGEGLGNKFLAHVREVGAIVQVVRTFNDSDVLHVQNRIDPKADIETINTELILADLATLESALQRLAKLAKTDPKLQADLEALTTIKQTLNLGRLLYTIIQSDPPAGGGGSIDRFLDKLGLTPAQDSYHLVKGLITGKPFIYLFNIDEESLEDKPKKAALAELVAPAPAVFVCAKLEAELAELEPVEARELLHQYGLEASGLEELIAAGFEALGLRTFLTAGPKEVRAWTIKKGATAPEAAGVIHTDFARGFIAAEVVNCDDLVAAGSKAAAKAKGLLRTEGKDYIVADGDVIEFRFNL